jgi:hypothetical protein
LRALLSVYPLIKALVYKEVFKSMQKAFPLRHTNKKSRFWFLSSLDQSQLRIGIYENLQNSFWKENRRKREAVPKLSQKNQKMLKHPRNFGMSAINKVFAVLVLCVGISEARYPGSHRGVCVCMCVFSSVQALFIAV